MRKRILILIPSIGLCVVVLLVGYKATVALSVSRKTSELQASGIVVYKGENSHHKRITSLRFSDIKQPINGEQCEIIRSLPYLTYVRADSNLMDDRAVECFSKCENLKTLFLDNSSISNKSGPYFKNCKNLMTLGLADTACTDKLLSYLAGCKNLESLFLDNLDISDEGVGSLVSLPKLRTLSLDGTSVTVNCLEPLQQIEQLQVLRLPSSDFIGTAELDEFRLKRPNVKIILPDGR